MSLFSVGALVIVLALSGCTAVHATSPAASSPASSASDEGGSSQPSSLESFVAAGQAGIPKLLASSNGTFSDIRIDALAPSTIVYTYAYSSTQDPAAAAAYFDSVLSSFQGPLDATVFPLMKKAGVQGALSAKYIYLNPDGTEIWTKTFESSLP